MVKKSDKNQNDLKHFQESLKDVKPIVQNKVRIPKPITTTIQLKNKPETTDEPFYFSEHTLLEPVKGDDFIEYHKGGLSHKTLRKLRKGQYNIDAILDLHGATVKEARTKLVSFIKNSLEQKARVVLVIHGKGHHGELPILKNKINQWLRELKVVLAFCSAIPTHGHHGSTYILLSGRITFE